MNLLKLYQILSETTIKLRKGEVVHGDKHLVEAIRKGGDLGELPGGTVTVDAMPHESEARADFEKVDLEFLIIGVDKVMAEKRRGDLVDILNTYPQPERLAAGPSYIEVGAEIGDQGAAFQLFALGKTLGLWDVITPGAMGITGDHARELAGSGFIMISGYRETTA